MFKRNLVMVMLLLCAIGFIQTAKAVDGPFLFDWQVRNFIAPGFEAITPIPHPGHDYEADHWYYQDIYSEMYSANRAIGLMLQEGTNPVDGTEDKYALSTVMGWAPRLDFVLADFEGPNRDAQTLEMINQVRSNSNPDISSAYIANYNDYPGAIDTSERWPEMSDRTGRDTFYRTSGLNIANPACYPYEYYSIHTWPSQWGTNISPNKRSALLWAPLEHFSVAKRNLPVGHLLIPWIGRFVEIEGAEYDAPIPTREDVRALVQHMRLRGADGYYRLAGILYTGATADPNENLENQWDSLIAWQCLDKVFEGPGAVSILNLDTNKIGGIEWSGVQKDSRIAILVSNLGNTSQRVNLPSLPGLPDYSDYVAPGEHMLRIYDVILPAADVCVKNNGIITNALYTSWFADSNSAGPYSYLKFDIADQILPAGYKAVIKLLKLETNVPSVVGSSYTDAVYSVEDDDWTESDITWANKPAIGSQLTSWTTLTSAGWLNINSSSLTVFAEQQANGDGTISLAVRDTNASRTSSQYQHYYAKEESEANCFRLVVEYEPLLAAMPTKTVVLIPIDTVCLSEWPGSKYKAMFQTNYWYGNVVNYMKYDLSELAPPLKYKTVVISISNINGFQTGDIIGDYYTDAFYEAADTWDFNSITWPTRPLPGAELVSWLFPGIYITGWTIPSTSAWATYAQNAANGDGVMSLCLKAVDGDGTANQVQAYYNWPSPSLTIAYYFELSEAPTTCEEAKAQHYELEKDLNGDCYVNLEDFAIIAERWLK